MEKVGGALERALRETQWNVDAIERSEGTISAGKRGWIGYRTIKIVLEAREGETDVTFELACKSGEFQEMMTLFEATLAQ